MFESYSQEALEQVLAGFDARRGWDFSGMHLTAAVTREGEWYVARCLQVEVTSQGETIEESLGNLREALDLYFEDAPAPEVWDVITSPVEVLVT